MSFARSQAAAAQTDVELVPAPGSGKQIVVYHVLVSSSVAGAHTLESGTTARRWEAYLAANDTVSDSGGGVELFRCADNASLTTTNVGAGSHFTQVTYSVRKSNHQ